MSAFSGSRFRLKTFSLSKKFNAQREPILKIMSTGFSMNISPTLYSFKYQLPMHSPKYADMITALPNQITVSMPFLLFWKEIFLYREFAIIMAGNIKDEYMNAVEKELQPLIKIRLIVNVPTSQNMISKAMDLFIFLVHYFFSKLTIIPMFTMENHSQKFPLKAFEGFLHLYKGF